MSVKISQLTPAVGANLTDLYESSQAAGGGTYVTKSVSMQQNYDLISYTLGLNTSLQSFTGGAADYQLGNNITSRVEISMNAGYKVILPAFNATTILKSGSVLILSVKLDTPPGGQPYEVYKFGGTEFVGYVTSTQPLAVVLKDTSVAQGECIPFALTNTFEPFNSSFSLNIAMFVDYQVPPGTTAILLQPVGSSRRVALPDASVNPYSNAPAQLIYVYNTSVSTNLTVSSFAYATDIVTLSPQTGRYFRTYVNGAVPYYEVVGATNIDNGVKIRAYVASATAVGEDLGATVTLTNASPVNYTIPLLNTLADVLSGVSYCIKVIQAGAGAVTLVPAVGVTFINPLGTLTTFSGKKSFILTMETTDTWLVE